MRVRALSATLCSLTGRGCGGRARLWPAVRGAGCRRWRRRRCRPPPSIRRATGGAPTSHDDAHTPSTKAPPVHTAPGDGAHLERPLHGPGLRRDRHRRRSSPTCRRPRRPDQRRYRRQLSRARGRRQARAAGAGHHRALRRRPRRRADVGAGRPFRRSSGRATSWSACPTSTAAATPRSSPRLRLLGHGLLRAARRRPADHADGLLGIHGLGRPRRRPWVTVFSNPEHAYMTVAGLRLDTSAADDPSNQQGPRWRPLRPAEHRLLRSATRMGL